MSSSLFLTREPTVLARANEGLAWADGPQWLPPDRLLFSDAHADALWLYSRSRGLFTRRLLSAGGCPAPAAEAGGAGAGATAEEVAASARGSVADDETLLAADLNGLNDMHIEMQRCK